MPYCRLKAELRTKCADLVRLSAITLVLQVCGLVDAHVRWQAGFEFFRIEGQDDTLALAKRLVEEARLGLAPGGAFGPEGNGWLRWCHATSVAAIEDGLGRLGRFLSR